MQCRGPGRPPPEGTTGGVQCTLCSGGEDPGRRTGAREGGTEAQGWTSFLREEAVRGRPENGTRVGLPGEGERGLRGEGNGFESPAPGGAARAWEGLVAIFWVAEAAPRAHSPSLCSLGVFGRGHTPPPPACLSPALCTLPIVKGIKILTFTTLQTWLRRFALYPSPLRPLIRLFRKRRPATRDSMRAEHCARCQAHDGDSDHRAFVGDWTTGAPAPPPPPLQRA